MKHGNPVGRGEEQSRGQDGRQDPEDDLADEERDLPVQGFLGLDAHLGAAVA